MNGAGSSHPPPVHQRHHLPLPHYLLGLLLYIGRLVIMTLEKGCGGFAPLDSMGLLPSGGQRAGRCWAPACALEGSGAAR